MFFGILSPLMGIKSTKLFVKPEAEGASIEVLQSLIMGLALRGITQTHGIARDKRRLNYLDDQGRYEIKILVNNQLARKLVDAIISHEGFRVVEEQTLDGKTVIGSIIHESTDSSHFPGRTK